MAAIDLENVIDYYVNLLIIQYNNKEKARATIELNVRTLLSDNVICEVQDGFNIETAVGDQLDIIGKYIGVDRFYNSFIEDDIYRFILKLRIVQNNSDHSHKSIDDGLFLFFGDSLVMSANENMTMAYFVDSDNIIDATIAFGKGVLPRPMGVQLNGLIQRDEKMLGFTNYNRTLIPSGITGFTNYTDGFTKQGEMLTYDKVINF